MPDHAEEYSFNVIEFTIRANESCFEEFECRKTLMKVLKLNRVFRFSGIFSNSAISLRIRARGKNI